MYYVDVNQLRTLWNSCGLVPVHETAVLWTEQARNNIVTSRLLIYLITVYFNVLVINKDFITYYFNFYCKPNGIPLSATLLYLKNILYWPEDGRLRSKRVAVMWPNCIQGVTGGTD